MTCSSWPGSARTGPRSRPCLTTSWTVSPSSRLSRCDTSRHDVGQLQHLRAQRLLAREGEQLAGQAGGAVRIRLDLLDVVIVAVARRVAHQHQVAMADDRGQDVVEIVRDAAGELADRLHLGRLRDLALELGLLAIVLEQQQHRRIAQPAQARRRSARPARPAGASSRTGKVARHRRAAGVAAHRVGDRRLVLLDDQIAGIGRHVASPLIPRGAAERLVHGQEAAVAVDQREAERQHVEQRLDVGRTGQARRRRAGRTSGACPAPPSRVGSSGTWTTRSGRAALALGEQTGRRPSSPVRRGRRSAALARRGRRADRAVGERRLAASKRAVGVDQRRHAPRPRQAARRSRRRSRSAATSSGSGAARRGEAPQQQVAARADALDLDRDRARRRRDLAGAAGAVAPRRDAAAAASRSRGVGVVARPASSGARVAEALAIGGVGDQQRAVAVGQRGRLARPGRAPLPTSA